MAVRFFVTAPQTNTLFFEFLLQELVQHQPGVFKIIFLDRAGYHLAKALRSPANIHLFYLPSSNPNRTADAGESCRTLLARSDANAYEKAVASLNFKDEAELEVWTQETIHA